MNFFDDISDAAPAIVPVDPWYAISEALQERISKAVRIGGHRIKEAQYHLNVLDLIDTEAAAFWRGDRERTQPLVLMRVPADDNPLF